MLNAKTMTMTMTNTAAAAAPSACSRSRSLRVASPAAPRAATALLRRRERERECSAGTMRRSSWARPPTSSAPARLAVRCMAKGTGAVDAETLFAERDACGVGLIARRDGVREHEVISNAINACGCMEHRGGCSADNDSGDGAGIMCEIPFELLRQECWPQIEEGKHGVGMLFLPLDDQHAAEARLLVEQCFESEGVKVEGFRDVPVNNEVVGPFAVATQPRIEQVLVSSAGGATGDALDRELFLARKALENADARLRAARESGCDDESFEGAACEWFQSLYVCSLHTRKVVYKGMLRSAVLGEFYLDLQSEAFKTSWAVYHRRFSTNTTPKWPLAQPFRTLGHNGEINTVQGNLNWLFGGEATLRHPNWEGKDEVLYPVGDQTISDSGNLDRLVELMVLSGRSPMEAIMVVVPEAYKNHPELEARYPQARDFYEFYAGLQEAWDGPALLVFCDGKHLGAALDRNGLRPARYWTTDKYVYVASEVGVIGDGNEDSAEVTSKGRLGPGHMMYVDLASGEVFENEAVKSQISSRLPYGEWVAAHRSSVSPSASTFLGEAAMSEAQLLQYQAAFGWSAEDVQLIITNMAMEGKEPTYCMGDDVPLPVLAEAPHQLFDYFKQKFAQVTNPAIDPLREGLVMGLDMALGARANVLDVGPEHARQLHLATPILNETQLEEVKASELLGTRTLSVACEGGDLAAALQRLCDEAVAAVREDGAQCLVLSDRAGAAAGEVPTLQPEECPIPILLAVGAVHHRLIREGVRLQASIVAESAQCFSTHHMATLVGYGASAVCPYLGLETARQWQAAPKTRGQMERGKIPTATMEGAQANYVAALGAGLKKILSKMGISLLSSYHGAQIFEIFGLGDEVVDLAFKGTVSRIGGLNLAEVGAEAGALWRKGFPSAVGGAELTRLENFGFIQSRTSGEYHANNPEMSKLLHKAVRQNDADAFRVYLDAVYERPASVLRDCVTLESGLPPLPLEEVESVADIVQRFCTGGMSLGAISRETHEVIAIAMNRIGGKSNSGEGGEDPVRYEKLADVDGEGASATMPHLNGLRNGDTATSRIKQVASGRFGVTPNFLMNAEQIEIKVAQGAKPGEGGQLPGKKVSPYIATLRRSKPGVPLISPPPHHDIYSIEDLAQLIFDLHQINPRAKVSVKLVASAGIGTIASGVAKAGADVIQVSGGDGGTGASPVSSIKHAGGLVEMGLVEVHRTLVENGLRDRVTLRVDGGLKSGRDVLMTAVLGSDEFGFGTIAMIATGCIMARICHTNNCPVGVASQREELRARFPGIPEHLENFFLFIGQEVREGLAELGLRSMDELVGRTELLRARSGEYVSAKTAGLDLGYLLREAGGTCSNSSSERIAQGVHGTGPVLDEEVLANEAVAAAIEANSPEGAGRCDVEFAITNQDRCACGRVGGVVAGRYGDTGFKGHLGLTFRGSAGQSFGAFTCGGMAIRLVGEANDYVGKSMSGGELVLVPYDQGEQSPPPVLFAPEDAVILGNTCLYGATGGLLFARGKAGERFAVRNSRCRAVIEGAGDHCCEYMTGGTVVVLGEVGRNIAAGMTGGVAFLLDDAGTVESKVNRELVSIFSGDESPAALQELQELLQMHLDRTGSTRAEAILADWPASAARFKMLVPPSELAEYVAPAESSLMGSSPSASASSSSK